MKFSGTYAAIIAQLIISIFALLKTDFPYTQDELEKAFTIIVAVGIALIGLYRRYRAGGITWHGFKIPTINLSKLNTLKPGDIVKFDDK